MYMLVYVCYLLWQAVASELPAQHTVLHTSWKGIAWQHARCLASRYFSVLSCQMSLKKFREEIPTEFQARRPSQLGVAFHPCQVTPAHVPCCSSRAREDCLMHLRKVILVVPCIALSISPAAGRPLGIAKERTKASTVSRGLLQDTASLVSLALPMPSPVKTPHKRCAETNSSTNKMLTGRRATRGSTLETCGMSLSCIAAQHLRPQGRRVRRWAGCQQQLRYQARHCL